VVRGGGIARREIRLLGAAFLAVGSVGQGAIHRQAAPARLVQEGPSRAAATKALKKVLAHHPQPAILVRAPSAHALGNLTQVQSYNWAGYADDNSGGGTYSKVSGSWTITPVTCTKEDQITSEWVGLDGFTSTTVEQDGTLAWCFQGTAFYYTWYEMYPAGTVTVGQAAHPGDKISGSVSVSGTTYTLKVTESTTPAESFTQTATCAAATCPRTSAEWIAERPAFSIGIAPLAHFTTAYSFTAGKATHAGTAGNINSFPDDQLTLIDATNTYDLTTTSALKSGTGFTVKWLNSY
jgi:Peptidase A4 family